MVAREMDVGAVMRNLNGQVNRIKGATRLGCVRAGFFVEAEATKNAPLKSGNLRGSGYTRMTAEGSQVGFEAEYAVFVHEIDNNYAIGGWKFLQRAVDENREEILEIIRAGARV